MRGIEKNQSALFSYFSIEERIPRDHPLRKVKALVDEALAELNPVFSRMYSSSGGRDSVPPERLLRSMILVALYSVRSDRQFCEMLDYNILFRWFLGMSLDEPGFDHSTFSKNRERLLDHEVARLFFEKTVKIANNRRLLSHEHFTIDGTMIEAWASLKSFQPKSESKQEDRPRDDDNDGGGSSTSNRDVNFRGEKRSNETHESTTDPEARLMRKGLGKEAKLAFTSNVLMENRSGLCVDVNLYPAGNRVERDGALKMIRRLRRRGFRPKTAGADKGYHTQEFVHALRNLRIRPHIARQSNRVTPGLDDRTTKTVGYEVSQRKRKRIEEIFGWMKTVGGMRKSRVWGVSKTLQLTQVAAAAYNLLRIPKLATI